MKIAVGSICRDHFATLKKTGESKISFSDVILFYITPLAGGSASIWADVSLEKEIYNISITFFGIFLALLLNLQVALFAVFQRKWKEYEDIKSREIQVNVIGTRRVLLGEVNANISYLTLVSCISLGLMLIFYSREMELGWAPAVTIAIYMHFLLTLLMIVKRSHAIFQKEYRDSPD